MEDIQFAEDEKDLMANKKVDDIDKTRPYLAKVAATKPINGTNSVDVNLQIYDQYKSLERGQIPDGYDAKSPMKTQATASKTPGAKMHGGIGITTPLRMNTTQHSVYGNDKSPDQFPQGPPMTDMTNVHPGTIMV